MPCRPPGRPSCCRRTSSSPDSSLSCVEAPTERLAGQVVDDLRGNVLVAARHAQPRTLGRAARPLAHAKRAPLSLSPSLFEMFHDFDSMWISDGTVPRSDISRLRCRLAGLATNLLAFVANAFAFVRFRLAHRADFGGELADQLLVGAFDHDVRLIGAGDGQARPESASELRWRSRRAAAALSLRSRPGNRRPESRASSRSPRRRRPPCC